MSSVFCEEFFDRGEIDPKTAMYRDAMCWIEGLANFTQKTVVPKCLTIRRMYDDKTPIRRDV